MGGINYRGLREDLLAARDALPDIRGRAESADGLVAVTVDGRGRLCELTLDPRIYRSPDSRALSADITATVAAATRLATEQIATTKGPAR